MVGVFVVNKSILLCEDFVNFDCQNANLIVQKSSYLLARVDKLLNEYLCTDYYHSSTLAKYSFFNDPKKDQSQCNKDIIPKLNYAMLGLKDSTLELSKLANVEIDSHAIHAHALISKLHLMKISDIIHHLPELKHSLFDMAFSDVYPASLGETFYPLVNLIPLPESLSRDLVYDIDNLVSDVDKILLASSELSDFAH